MDLRRRLPRLLVVGLLMLAGCTNQPARQHTSASSPPPSAAATPAGQVGQTGSACRVTAPTTARPPDPGTASFSSTWYHTGTGAIWASQTQMYAGGNGNKVLWAKPKGAKLHVSGRRLDGPAPPLVADLPEGYNGSYQASGLDFPTGGCWRVEATAGTSTLRFVALIYPRIYQSPQQGCPDLAATVRQADAVVVATVEGVMADRPGFWWATVHVQQVLTARPRGLLQPASSPDRRLDVLFRPGMPAGIVRVGGRYLLVVVAIPGLAPQLACDAFALARVVGNQVLAGFPGQRLPWSGTTVAAVEREVKAAAG